jgi:glycosyltransferase involved in cell wall biosynthesis
MSEAIKVSVIMPVYNAGRFVESAVQSVLNQSYENWELLLINDGSTDNSQQVLHPFLSDSRISYFEQENQGVSVARNVGLDNASGDWVCFLDADDEMYPNSIGSRIALAQSNPNLYFIDGTVHLFDDTMKTEVSVWTPTHQGEVFNALMFDTSTCFIGVTWMLKSTQNLARFQVGLTHGEDLLFFILNAKTGNYGFVDSPTIKVRTGHQSAMTNLKGLEQGYRSILVALKARFPELEQAQLKQLEEKYRSIMVKCYAKKWKIWSALSTAARFP